MYVRRVGKQKLTLGVSGMLWQSSVVLYDQETRSLWSHILGQAKAGPLRGTRLRQIPSVITTWKRWKQAHPQTTVGYLPPTAKRFRRQFLQVPRRVFVIALRRGKAARAWSLRDLALRQDPCLNETWQGEPLVVVLDPKSYTARVFSRCVGSRVLEFYWQGERWLDRQSGTGWDPVTGRGLEGPLRGAQLRQLEGFLSYSRIWAQFHPQSQFWPPGWNPAQETPP